MSIKIGNIDVSYFKVGSGDCSIYLGSEKLYPTTPSSFKYKLALSDSTTVSAECDASSAVTSGEVSTYKSTLVSAEIGDCVTDIGQRVFYYCISLTSVIIPDSVTSIGSSAFTNCNSLTSITIPSGVTSIGDFTFRYCSGLTSVDIPSGVTIIGSSAFRNCYNLTGITIPDSVTSMGDYAFAYSNGLTSITIPDSVTDIGQNVFEGCSGLTTVTIGSGVTSINRYAFRYCSGLTSVDIPNSVTSISGYAFDSCTSLSSVTIPSGVTTINTRTFYNCNSLTSVTIPDSVTIIGMSAFYNCSGLTSVTIGSGATSISGNAFSNCTSLTSITINATTPPTLNSSVFNNTNNCPIYVPCESVNVYKSATNWSTYADRITCIPHDYSQDYFTMVVVGEDGTFSWSGSSSANCLSYSTDSGATWSEPSSAITTSTLSSGDTVLWKGSGMSPLSKRGIGTFSSTIEFNAEGNIMSLLFGDNFSGQTDLTGYDYAFYQLLGPNKVINAKLVNVDNLMLPATTLTQECYYYLFRNQKIASAPELPAITLTTGCYNNMFNGCTSLNSITCLATDISATRCTNQWVTGVAASGTFTKAASMTSWTTGNNGIPSGWTVVDYSS